MSIGSRPRVEFIGSRSNSKRPPRRRPPRRPSNETLAAMAPWRIVDASTHLESSSRRGGIGIAIGISIGIGHGPRGPTPVQEPLISSTIHSHRAADPILHTASNWRNILLAPNSACGRQCQAPPLLQPVYVLDFHSSPFITHPVLLLVLGAVLCCAVLCCARLCVTPQIRHDEEATEKTRSRSRVLSKCDNQR